MKPITTLLGLLTIMSASAPAQPATLTDECDRGGVLTGRGIGPLRIGMTADSLARRCRVISQRRIHEHEATEYLVRVGADTLPVRVQGGRVQWIRIESPIHRTRDSLGIGSSAQRLLHLTGITGGVGDGSGEYGLFTKTGEHCGITFWLDGATADMLSRAKGDALRLLGMRGSGTVVAIDIVGVNCVDRKPPSFVSRLSAFPHYSPDPLAVVIGHEQ